MRFFHQGQLDGRLKRISPHLVRAPVETANEPLQRFYDRLLSALQRPALREGDWRLLECASAWDGNWTRDSFLGFWWQGTSGDCVLVVVNYADHQSQCYVRLPLAGGDGRTMRFSDVMGTAIYDRADTDLATHGLYLDMPPWGYHVFELTQ
jgi:hypothetical protein